MRILLLNPNMTTSMTDQMVEIARGVAGEGVEIVPLTATSGFPYISSRAEAQIAGALVLEMIAEHREGIDAVIIAAFGDPGLVAARELFDLPVVGVAEVAVMTAALLGDRFSVVTFSPHMARWYTDCVEATGLQSRFTGVCCPTTAPKELSSIQTKMRGDLIALTRQATDKDGADVVIIGGAPLAGLAPLIAPQASGILVDPVAAATLQAIALAGLSPSYARRAGRPVAKKSTGLGAPLAALIAGD
jgi:Asp/Glu/hydantoin racemase